MADLKNRPGRAEEPSGASAKPPDAAEDQPFPVFEVPPGAPPITPEMVRHALEDD